MMTWDKTSGWHLWKLTQTQLGKEKLYWVVSEEPTLLLGVSSDGKLRKTQRGDGALTWKRQCGFSELPALLTPFGDVGWITQPQNYWQVQQEKLKPAAGWSKGAQWLWDAAAPSAVSEILLQKVFSKKYF